MRSAYFLSKHNKDARNFFVIRASSLLSAICYTFFSVSGCILCSGFINSYYFYRTYISNEEAMQGVVSLTASPLSLYRFIISIYSRPVGLDLSRDHTHCFFDNRHALINLGIRNIQRRQEAQTVAV